MQEMAALLRCLRGEAAELGAGGGGDELQGRVAQCGGGEDDRVVAVETRHAVDEQVIIARRTADELREVARGKRARNLRAEEGEGRDVRPRRLANMGERRLLGRELAVLEVADEGGRGDEV